MSYDFALKKVCPHKVVREDVSLGLLVGDTIRFPRIPSSNSVEVFLGDTPIPRSGLFSPPSFTFSSQGPFRIVSKKSDLLKIQLNNEAPFTVELPTGVISAKDLSAYLDSKIDKLSFSSSSGKITMTGDLGVSKVCFIDPTWNDPSSFLTETARISGAYKSLGINPGRVLSSRKIFPGWKVTVDKASLTGEVVVLFDESIKNSNPILSLTYVTSANQCRRCHGTRIEYDYSIVGGSYETVSGTDLLLQEFDKFMFTDKGSHWRWSWLGSSLQSRIGGKGSTSRGSASSFITMDVTQAFKIYQNIKSQQDNILSQRVSDEEYPLDMKNLKVSEDPNDPTIVNFSVDIISRSRNPITLVRVVETPDKFYLPGSAAPFSKR